METLYIFLDEGGNFDFSRTGTVYFTLTSIVRKRPFRLNSLLDDYKYDLLEYGFDQEYFHCSEDNRRIRENVFERIVKMLHGFRIDSLIVEKCKTGPALRDERHFYPKMLGYLLRHVLIKEMGTNVKEVIVVTDTLPTKKKLRAVEKSVKQTLAKMLPESIPYRVLHHASKSHYGLQIADYCNWAIYRKWSKNDSLYYELLEPAIRSEFDIFKSGETKYY